MTDSGGDSPASGDPRNSNRTSENRLSQALDEYSGSLASGQVVDHREFLSRYSDIGPVLADCLVGLDLVHRLKGTPEAPDAVGDTTDGRSGWDTGPLSDLEPLLGDFRILREIGRGGMGVVYEAEQISLRRRVALKVLPFAAALDPRQLARFKNEVRAAATLDHPGIVAVHSVGCDRGVHYYAMQLINGPSLAELITRMQSGMLRGSWPEARTSESTAEPTRAAFPAATGSPQEFIRYVARLGIQGAEALEYAHQHGIVHRDIKPANLLLDSHGNLRIADFGLARIEADASMTLTGDMLGTLRYASPEQALGQRALIDHRTDIYSLGATLYELLTLHPPFLITDRPVLLNQIAHHEPPRPRQFNREIPPDLETIVLHALSKLPAERYAAAGELAEDLRRFVDGQPIRARRKGLADRMAGLARRHQALVWSAAAALIVTVALALISTLLVLGAWRQERQQRQIAEGLQRIAEDQTQRAEQLLYVDRLRRAGEAWAEQDMLRVVELLHEEPSGVELGPQRGFEWHFLDQAARWQAEPLAAYDAALYDVGFSPDGRWIGCTGADGIVRFHAAQTGKLEHLLETAQGETNCVVFAPDGQSFATAGDDGTVKLWDWNLRTALWSVSAYQKPAYDVGFTPDGAVLASCGDDPIIHLWQAADGAHLGSLKGHHGAVERICFSPDGQRLASAGRDRTVRVWDWKTRGEPLIFAETSVMPAVEFGPDGSWLVAVGQSSRAILSWSLRSKRQIHLFPDPVHRDDLRSLALSTHGRLAATGDDRGGIRLWQIPAAELPKEPPPATEEHGVDPVDDSVPTQTIRWRMAMSHSGRVYGLAFSPDEAQLVSAGQDGKLMRLAARKAPDHFRPVNDLPLVRELAAVGDQPLLATAGGSGVTLIRSQDGQHVQTLADEPQTWLHAAVNPSGNMLAASSRAGEIRVWQLPSLGEIYRGTPASSETELYFVPGTRNLSLSNDSSPWIDPQAGLFRPPYPVAPAQCHAFSPDQQHVAIARPISNSVEIWNWRTGKMLLTLPDAGMALQRLLYSPTGRWLAAVRGNRHLIVWNLDHHEPQFTAAAHDIRIEDLCFTPDELTLMTAGKDGNIRLWHVLTGRRLFDLVSLRRTSIDSLALAYGGRHMAFVAQPEYQTANNLVYIGAGVEP